MLCTDRVSAIRRQAYQYLELADQLARESTRLECIANLLEVTVLYAPCPDETFTGIGYDDGIEKAVVLNPKAPIPAQRWRLAHELGHVARRHPTARRSTHEEAADLFAMEVLLPACRLGWQMRQHGPDPSVLGAINQVRPSLAYARMVQLDNLIPGWRQDGGFSDLLKLAC